MTLSMLAWGDFTSRVAENVRGCGASNRRTRIRRMFAGHE
jgi:hypothetical protein